MHSNLLPKPKLSHKRACTFEHRVHVRDGRMLLLLLQPCAAARHTDRCGVRMAGYQLRWIVGRWPGERCQRWRQRFRHRVMVGLGVCADDVIVVARRRSNWRWRQCGMNVRMVVVLVLMVERLLMMRRRRRRRLLVLLMR